MDLNQEKLLSIGIVILLGVSGLATIVYYKDDVLNSNSGNQEGWIDPITEVENCENCTGQDANHQHTDIMQHFLQTHNVTLIDYHSDFSLNDCHEVLSALKYDLAEDVNLIWGLRTDDSMSSKVKVVMLVSAIPESEHDLENDDTAEELNSLGSSVPMIN